MRPSITFSGFLVLLTAGLADAKNKGRDYVSLEPGEVNRATLDGVTYINKVYTSIISVTAALIDLLIHIL
jgi:hypothetical protein